MSSFTTWLRSQQQGKGLRQFTYICGAERVLVDTVLDTLTRSLLYSKVPPYNHAWHVAGSVPERNIWNSLYRKPIGRSFEAMLTVITNAEKLEKPERFAQWMANRKLHPGHYVILVSNEEAAPRVEVADGKTNYPSWLRFTSAAYVIECKPFTQATAKYAAEWVKSIAPMSDSAANHLLDRANGDLRLVRDASRKLAVFKADAITKVTIDQLLDQEPRDSFVEALLAIDRPAALSALAHIPKQDFALTIGRLQNDLDFVGMVHDAVSSKMPRAELMKRAGKRAFLVPRMEQVAQHYNPTRARRQTDLIMMASDVLGTGETEGVMEALVALW